MSKIKIMQEPDENKIPFLVYLSLVLHFKKCSLFLPVWSSTLISKNNDFFFFNTLINIPSLQIKSFKAFYTIKIDGGKKVTSGHFKEVLHEIFFSCV